MLQLLGVELCGEPLHWDDVRPFILRFEEMDVSKRGRISREDLDAIYQAEGKEHEKLMQQIHWSDSTLHLLEEFEHEREERAYKQQWSHDQIPAGHQTPSRPRPLVRSAAQKRFGKVAHGVAAVNMMRMESVSSSSRSGAG